MKIFRFILIIIGIFLVLLFTIPVFLPSSSYVERSIEINKPIDEVFKVVADFKTYKLWNTWTQMDKDAVFNILNNDPILGSKIEWNGDTIGTGYLKRTKVEEDALIESDMVFTKPLETTSKDIMKFVPTEKGTKVFWANKMALEYPFGRYMSFIMESFLGTDFEKGLAMLKSVCDSTIKTKMYAIREEKAIKSYIYYISDSTALDSKSITHRLSAAYIELTKFYKKNKLEEPKAPIAVSVNHNEDKWWFDAGFIAPDTSLLTSGRIKKGILEGKKVLKCVYIGSYGEGYLAYKQLHNYMLAKNYVPDGKAWEEYVSDAATTPEKELVTNIYYPVKKK